MSKKKEPDIKRSLNQAPLHILMALDFNNLQEQKRLALVKHVTSILNRFATLLRDKKYVDARKCFI